MSILFQMSVHDIMNPLVETADGFIAEQTGLSKKSSGGLGLQKVEKLMLKEVSSFIDLKGIIKGKFVVSMDRRLIREIVRNYAVGSITEDEIEEYMEDTLAECANIILGNSIKMFPNIEEDVFVDAPVTLCSRYAAFRYPETGIWTSMIEYGYGSVSVSFISSDIAA